MANSISAYYHHKTQLVSDLKAAGFAGSWEPVGRPSSVGSREKRDVKSKLTWSIPIEAGELHGHSEISRMQ